MNFNKLFFWLVNLLIISSLCVSSCQSDNEDFFPFISRKYEEVDPEFTKHLLIPFFENGKYGLANYEGEIKLKPQFTELKMINLACPFFWAGEKDAMTLRYLEGKEVLNNKNQPIKKTDFRRFEQLEWYDENIPRYDLLLRILENEEEAKKDSKKVRYYYLNAKTKRPLRSYSLQNYDHLKEFTKQHRLDHFQSDNGTDSNVKVMTEDGKFTFLDKNGNEIITPNFNCYLLNDDKMIMYREDGLASLKDLKRGWQTDFFFQKIRETANPNIFTAEIFNKKDRTTSKFIIGKDGKVMQLDVMGGEMWKVINEKYSLRQKKDIEDKYKTNYWLFDNITFTKVKDLPSGKLYEIFDTYGVDFSNDENEKRFVTLKGDTLLKPIYRVGVNMNESVYKFKNGAIQGIADKDGNVLLEIEAKQISYRTDKTIELRKGKKYGWANADGKIIFSLEYDKVEFFEKVERVIVGKDKKYGLYDLDGKEILPMIYRSISPEISTKGNGIGFRLVYKDQSFVVSPDLELIKGGNFDNPVNHKSMFSVVSDSEEIKKDFPTSRNPILFTNYYIFQGLTHVHIFRSDKKYIGSFEGMAGYHEHGVYVGKTNIFEEGLRLSGLLEINRGGTKVWVRLRDGFVFEK
ncbi:MAG: WG repeat-containing protein [Saprospiraceae bacterium]